MSVRIRVRYWERSSWSDYMRNCILPLYKSSLTIMNFWRRLVDVANGKLLSEVIGERPKLEYAFIGGTSPPNKYEEGSLAKVYKELLGAFASLREYYFLKSYGKEPKTVCTVSKTEILRYVDHISTLLERVLVRACETGLIDQTELQDAREASEEASQGLLAEPENLPETLIDFLNKALSMTVAYNEYTRFIWHLRKIPKKYIAEFYPEMLKPEVFKFIQEISSLREYIVPRVEDPELVDLYTIFSFDYAIETVEPTKAGYAMVDGMQSIHVYRYFLGELPWGDVYEPYTTIGGCLCRINELIWGLFRHSGNALKLIVSGDIPEPFEDWQSMAVSELPIPYTREN